MIMGMIIVSDATYPSLYHSMITIMYDVGAINRFQSEPNAFLLKGYDIDRVQTAENQLAKIPTSEELELFCTGSDTEREELIAKYGLTDADIFLNTWFEEDFV